MTVYNYIDTTGLHLQSLTEIVTDLETGFKNIYGSDINLEPNSPDSQMINLFAQAKIDILDLISQVYGSFSPSSAIGAALDQRCALNGIIRHGATKATVTIDLTTTKEVVLVGLSNASGTPFTVLDPSGNKFYLTTGVTGATGVTGYHFTAAEAGAIEIAHDTLTNIETVTLGVSSATNASSSLVAGVNEETDAALRYRRSVSVSNPSSGYLDGLQGGLLAIANVEDAKVYENITDTTNGYNIPGHSIWPIVDYVSPAGATGATGASGVSGSQTAIATEIYKRRNAGCGMTGAVTEQVMQINGFTIPIKYSYAAYKNLYIYLNMTSLDASIHIIDSAQQDYLKDQIYENFVFGIDDAADYSAIASFVKTIDPYAVIIAGGLGGTGPAGVTGCTYPFLKPSTAFGTLNNKWVVQTANIAITVV